MATTKKGKKKNDSWKNFNDPISVRPRKGNEGLKAKLQALAEKKDRSFNEFVERILDSYVEVPYELYP